MADANPGYPMSAMPIGDHRNVVLEVWDGDDATAYAYWTGSFWAFAPISDDPKPLPFTPVLQRAVVERISVSPAGRAVDGRAPTDAAVRAPKKMRLNKNIRAALRQERAAARTVETAIRQAQVARRSAGLAFQRVCSADAALHSARTQLAREFFDAGICPACRSTFAETENGYCEPCDAVPF